MPLWLVVVIAVATLGLGAALGTPPDEEGASPAPSSGATGTASETEGREAASTMTTGDRQTTTTTRPASTTTTAPSTTTTTAPPRAGFGGGTQLVGTDVAPGIYVAADLDFCYWERLSGVSGSFDDIITNDNATGQAVVEIRPTDAAFNSQRCGRWELYAPPTAPTDSFGPGDWIVGEQIEPGRYRAESGSFCYWERASGLSHDFAEIIANDLVSDGTAVVEISPGDRRFSSNGCGTWRRA